MQLIESILADAAVIAAMRRDIHAHPELCFQEERTADVIAKALTDWGIPIHRGLGKTGVVGIVKNGSSARAVGLRADIDALPMTEHNHFAHASTYAGKMHACGHDGHTAMLLAAARHLADSGRFDGTLQLIFQPAEEGGGGALRMMADGLFERFPCDAVFAMHNMPGIAQGHLVLREGAAMASSDYATITIEGTGGHGAMPQHAADPVVAAASLVMALQTVVSRNVDPLQAAVVTVGALQAGQANNVIPASARLELSVRALDREVRALLERRIRALAVAQAEGFGCRAQIDWRSGYAVLVNTPAETAFAREVALELLGPERVTPQGPPLTGSEDFAFMLERVPGSYLLIGNGQGADDGSPASAACMVHHPGYDFNDANLPVGAAYWVRLAERFLVAA